MQEFVDLLKEKLVEINEKPPRCKRCLMDETAEGIEFNANGCNYCEEFLKKLDNTPKVIDANLDELVSKVKEDGKNKPYDCIVGLSGGVDSSYTLVKVKELGLRPLAVHMDNGWNSELAANNIKNLVEKLGVDLYTHVVDWNEYKALMEAFFEADVIDIELLYDNAMLAVNYKLASKYGIKYILSGSNSATEGMRMPNNWNWFKYDKKNIKSIAHQNRVKIKTFPMIGTMEYLYCKLVKKISWIPFLDYVKYNKVEAMRFLVENYAFKPYPYKHYESIFTRFYQGYILPVKFGVDKRKLHLSTLICSNQMSREEALDDLKKIPYPSELELEEDKEYFLKKMGWSILDFLEYLHRNEKRHDVYKTERPLWEFYSNIYNKYIK